MATYALHHVQKFEKTNSVDEEMKLVFADLTSEEITSSFLLSTTDEMREQMLAEIKFGTLLETASWLADNYKQGCVKCAPFLSRTMLNPYPSSAVSLINEHPTFTARE